MDHKIAVFDVDGTIIDGQSQRYLIAFLLKKKYIGIFKFLGIYAWFLFYSLGRISNPQKVLSFALSGFVGRTKREFDDLIDSFFKEELVGHIWTKSRELVSKYQAMGYQTILLSTAIKPLISRLALFLGVKECYATELIFEKGVFNGVIEPMFGDRKVVWLKNYCGQNGISLDNVAVFTDHHSDSGLLSIVHEPHAVNPTSRLKEEAVLKDWPIITISQ